MKKILAIMFSIIFIYTAIAGCAISARAADAQSKTGAVKSFTLTANSNINNSKNLKNLLGTGNFQTMTGGGTLNSADAALPEVILSKPVDFYGITFSVSPEWKELRVNSPLMKEYGVLADDPSSIISMEKGSLNAYMNESETTGKSDSELLYLLFKNLGDTNSVVKDITIGADTVNGKNFIKGLDYKNGSLIKFYMFINKDALYILNMETDSKNTDYMNGIIKNVAGSITSNGNYTQSAPADNTGAAQNSVKNYAQATQAAPVQSKAPTRQQRAIEMAKDLLKYGAYTRYDLPRYLQKAGFTPYEAEYAAEHCGANWADQALRKANDYLEYMPYSKAGLKAALENIGYTSAEADYAVANCRGWR